MFSKAELDNLYGIYNRRSFVHPDPLEFLYDYPEIRDREIVGLIASALAYGRVAQILKSVALILRKTGPSPFAFVRQTRPAAFASIFKEFKHRFTTHRDITDFFCALHRILGAYGSLNNCWRTGMGSNDSTVLPAMENFLEKLNCTGGYLLPLPRRGSACKRMHLYLRWMVRKDAVDPGGWEGISPRQLIIPLDTHMARIARSMRMTRRKSANQGMAEDVTAAFRTVAPDDPVKYDFALTRFGIRSDMDIETLLGKDRSSAGQLA